MVSLASFVCSFPCVAFSGSRVASSSASVSCRSFLPVLGGFSASVGVGCASGVDSLVRSAFPSASVFRVGSLPLVVVFPVLRLLCVRLRLFLGALLRAVCLLLFRSVLVLLVCRFLLRSVVVVRVRGVLWRLPSVWVFLCLWCRLWALVRLGLVRLLLRSAVSVLLLAVAFCGVLFLFHLWAVSFLCFSPPVGGLLDF